MPLLASALLHVLLEEDALCCYALLQLGGTTENKSHSAEDSRIEGWKVLVSDNQAVMLN